MTAEGGARAFPGPGTANRKTTTCFCKQNSVKKGTSGKERGCTISCTFVLLKQSERSSVAYLKSIGCKMVDALHMSSKKNSHKVASSERAKPTSAAVDSHRAEAINDCIEFINSSASLTRSNSVAR